MFCVKCFFLIFFSWIRCVAPDGRGYGDTEKPTAIAEYTIDKLAADVKNLVNGRQVSIILLSINRRVKRGGTAAFTLF